MKKIEKLDKYFITPKPRFYGGFKYDGEDIFLCDDIDTDEDYMFHVVQKIENGILITDIEKEYKLKDNSIKEKTHMEIEINKEQILVYVEGQGYVLPEYRMNTLEEVIGIYEIMRGGSNDTKRDEGKDI